LEEELDHHGGSPGTPLSFGDLKNLPYTLAVFKEAMRIYPPAYVVGRRAIADVELGPHSIKRGGIVLVNIVGIHRRPDLYPDPDRFAPERFLDEREKLLPRGAYLPFGGGPRICIGSHFALMEGQLILATIARAFRFNRTTAAPPELEPLVTLRPRGGIEVQVERRATRP
jgi:cytochrome P450